jgi:hypothetical protein
MAATATVTTTARRVLVVANEAVDTDALRDALRVRTRKARAVDVLVVAPALNSRLRYWLSDEDVARGAAAERLAHSLEHLRAAGFNAEGVVADADPLRAIDDALALFPADEIVVATHARDRPHWLARDLVRRARLRYGQPIVHVVAAREAPV